MWWRLILSKDEWIKRVAYTNVRDYFTTSHNDAFRASAQLNGYIMFLSFVYLIISSFIHRSNALRIGIYTILITLCKSKSYIFFIK